MIDSNWKRKGRNVISLDRNSETPIRERVSNGHRYLLLAAAMMTYLLVTLGGIVCITNSSQGCPDWPRCYGQLIPPLRLDSIIEYTHRLVAALTTPLIIAAAIVGWRKTRAVRWLSLPPIIAVILAFAVIVFGAFSVLTGLPPILAAIDLGAALMVLALIVVAAVVAWYCRYNPEMSNQISFRKPFAMVVLFTVIAVFIVFVSGVIVADSGSMVRCLGWPLNRVDFETSGSQSLRHLFSAITGVFIAAIIGQTWRKRHDHSVVFHTAAVMGGVFLVEIGLGLLLRAGNSALFLLMAYVALASLLWVLLVVLVIMAGLSATSERRING